MGHNSSLRSHTHDLECSEFVLMGRLPQLTFQVAFASLPPGDWEVEVSLPYFFELLTPLQPPSLFISFVDFWRFFSIFSFLTLFIPSSSSHGSLQKHHVQFPISLFLLFKVRTLTIKRITLECEQCHVRSFMSQSLDKLIHILGRGIESAISFFTQVILHLVICREPPF